MLNVPNRRKPSTQTKMPANKYGLLMETKKSPWGNTRIGIARAVSTAGALNFRIRCMVGVT